MTNEHDDELGQVLANTLERSLDDIDPQTLAHLAQARHRALQRRHRRRVAGGLALAAGIAALAVLPMLSRQNQQGATDTSYLATDPQLLADMDMLEALGAGEMALDGDGA